jgi:hypothetical protein
MVAYDFVQRSAAALDDCKERYIQPEP